MSSFIDVDNAIIHPSPQRVRNILTLDERVAAIKAYDSRPMYTKVARMFNCSWEQIKNIITNRDAIMEFYDATKSAKKPKLDPKEELEMDLRQRKFKFLGECVYESLQRIQYHANLPITEELIRLKALEFQDLLKLEDFQPNKHWVNLFKATYNFSLSNKQIAINRTPPPSLDLKDIMTYCTKLRVARTNNALMQISRTNNTLMQRYSSFDANTEEYETKRLRKLNLLQKVLSEYLLRAKYHHKSMKLNDEALRQVALDFNEVLKVQDFEPTLTWIHEFRNRHEQNENLVNVKKAPLFTLDLKDILSYCSRMDNKAKSTTITLAPKETALQMRVMPKYPNKPEPVLKFQPKSIIYLEESEEKDVKPDIDEMRNERAPLEQYPPLKIRKIESINNDPELQQNFQNNCMESSVATTIVPKVIIKPIIKESTKESVKAHIFIKKLIKEHPVLEEQEVPVRVKQEEEMEQVNIKEEKDKYEDNTFILPTNSINSPQSSSQHQPPSPVISQQNNHYHPEDSDVELPRHVTTFKDVLLLLKPLEEYAMLKENYRAIGLITQLEEVLKNDPENNHTEDEFIG